MAEREMPHVYSVRKHVSVISIRAPRRDLATLKERFETAQDNYEVLRDANEARVTRWHWASSTMYELDPLFFLDPHLAVGRAFTTQPKDVSGKVVYGFSSNGQLVVEREFTEFPENFYQSFYIYLQDRVVGYRFHITQSLSIVNCSQLIVERSTPVCFQRWGVRGWMSYLYKCTNHRIDSYTAVSQESEEPVRVSSAKLRYKDNGLVELWVTERGGSPELSYRGRSPAESPFVLGHDR